ncbi:MAG: hypothetical protein HQL31_08270 [Planctomycetes bacterium]|nr:hypothetical protein [Planctomycetota bacterium]
MIFLITGTPGSGKTLRAIWLLEKPEFKDRVVFSNIPGTDHHPLPEGDDWTKTPEGSVVIYDEAQQFFPGTGKAGNSNDPRITALETHRHSGHDLIFITQRYALIHHHIRGLVGNHCHLTRKTSNVAVCFEAEEVFDPKDKAKNSTIRESVFRYPKGCFDKYTSSSLHTAAQTKLGWPFKLKVLGVAIVLGLAFVVWQFSRSTVFSAEKEKPAETAVAPMLNQIAPGPDVSKPAELPNILKAHFPGFVVDVIGTVRKADNSGFSGYFKLSHESGRIAYMTSGEFEQLGYKLQYIHSCLVRLFDYPNEYSAFCIQSPEKDKTAQTAAPAGVVPGANTSGAVVHYVPVRETRYVVDNTATGKTTETTITTPYNQDPSL